MTTTTTIMSTSLNHSNHDNNVLLYGPRLVWMERSPKNWWPALTFDNYGQALSELSHQLSPALKGSLTLKFIADPSQRVAQFVKTMDFQEISAQTVTLHFSDHIGKFYSARRQEELAPAMDIIKTWLAHDVNQTGGLHGNITTTTTNSLDIGVHDAWSVVWQRLRQAGWKKKHTKSGNVCWVFPGASRSCGIHGKDYFNTLQELQDYVRREYNWKGNSTSTTSAAVVQQEPTNKNHKRNREPEPSKRIWGRAPNQQQATVVSTPQNQKTRPQDPAKPLLSSSSSEEEDNYTWKPLWDSLKKKGWTAIGAAKYNILHDWYYVRPRCSVDTGTMGVDYFHDPTDVIDFIRAQEERNDDFGAFRKRKEAIRTLSSPRKRSRKSRIQEEFANAASTTASTSTTIKSTVVAATRTKKKQPMKKWWFHDEALPSFRQVWNILHTKLDFLYSGGCYKLPSGKETFTCDYDMRCHLLQHGIPNIHRLLDPDDVTLLTRWVTFAHVPVKDTNSIVKLENMQELTTEQALAFLRKINFVQTCDDGSIRRGDSEAFASLQEVRDYLRASSSLTPPVQGRRARGNKFEITLSENQVLELRLWAALSPTPLPTFPQDDAEQQATTPANGASTSTEIANENDDAAMELDQDESCNDVKSKSNTTNSIVCAGSEDDEDGGVPPNFFASSTRVSMSPSLFDYQPMTQQE
jgi:hypothetical protein